MAMTNLNYNHSGSSNNPQQLQSNASQPVPNPPKQCQVSNAPNCHYTNYAGATNLSHLSPIFEGEVFPSPSNTISPSLSHNHIDSNHVVLFHSNSLTPTNTDSKTPKTPNSNHDSVSPTTSVSSSNSSNTPTPTTYNTSNSLFNIPSTNNHPPCIPSVGLMNPNISKSSSTSSSSSASVSASPSPSLDTTVSPVTKMDLFKDLKIFEDIDTDEHAEHFTNHELTIDYLTGDKHCGNQRKRRRKQRNYNVAYSANNEFPTTPQSPLNSNSLHHNLTPASSAESTEDRHKPEPLQLNHLNGASPHNGEKEIQKASARAHKSRKKKHRHHHHRHHHHRHHRHSHHHRERKKKKRRKSERNSCSDSDSELQMKGKIRDKIKSISIRVPGDPNGLYKYWKRTKNLAKHKHHHSSHGSSSSHSPLRIFAENKESHVTQKQSILDLRVKTKTKTTNKNRDRLNSYPPNNAVYSIKSPQTYSNGNNTGDYLSIPPLIQTSQSCSNLLDKSIIIHTPNKENRDENKKAKHPHHYFSVLGLERYQNKKRNDTHFKKESVCNVMSGDHKHSSSSSSLSSPSNRARMNSYPPYMSYEATNQSVSIERTNCKSPAAHANGMDDAKGYHEREEADDTWHYTKHRKQRQIHQQRRMAAKNGTPPHHGSLNSNGGAYYDNNPYLNPYYLSNYHDTKHMHSSLLYDCKWKNDEDVRIPNVCVATDSLSEPNPSTTTMQFVRRRKNLSDHHKDNRYNIHPSMKMKRDKTKHKMNPQSAKMTGNLVDL